MVSCFSLLLLGTPTLARRERVHIRDRFTPNVATKRMALKDGEAASYPCEKPFMIVRVDDDNQ
jgi:hypothetical protein